MMRTLAAIAAALLATGARAQTPPEAQPAAPAAPAAAAPAPKAEAKPKGTFAIGTKSQISFAGRAWAEFNNVRTDKGEPGGVAAQNLSRISNNASYFQVRGERSFGEGFKAVGQFEAEVGLEGQDGTPFSGTRNTFVGLDTPYGLLQVGRFDSPVKDVGIGRDPGAGTGIFGYYTVFTGYRADRRLTNAIMYTSPEIQGLELSLAFSMGEAKFAATTAATMIPQRVDPYVVSGAVQYKNKTPYGPLYVGVGYEFRNDCDNPDANPSVGGAACSKALLGDGNAPNGTDQVIRVGADFKLLQTFTKLALVYDRIDAERPAKYGQPKLNRTRDAYWFSIVQGILSDKHQAIFNFGLASDFSGTGTTKDTGLSTYMAQYRYNFDANLFAYVALTQIFNDKAQNATFGGGGPTAGTASGWAVPMGGTVTGWGTGLRYNF